MAELELKIDIFGRVQGVGFRQFVKKVADSFGIGGFVRNRQDGSVFVVAQGSRKELQKFLVEVQKGPLFSKISGFSYAWRKKSNSYNEFLIAVDSGFIKDQKSSFTNLGRFFLQRKNLPLHVAIIPDGNRRWAKEKGFLSSKGHEKAIEEDNLMALFKEARELGVKYVSLWGFSTENWKRDKEEVDYLFDLFRKNIEQIKVSFMKEKIRFRHLGRKDRLPRDIISSVEELERETRDFSDFNVQFCLDYGGRDELARAINKMLKSGIGEIDESKISSFLDTDEIPDPDLIIRTSGEQRTSGFMPFQGAYAELYFSELYFPDFGPTQLKEAVEEFVRRKRNFGA
ncbi:MAG: polyprenyl diphosphate synthase [Nanoarchaeota archaeon]